MARTYIVRLVVGLLSFAFVAGSGYYLARRLKIKNVLAASQSPYTIWYRDATYRTKIGDEINFDNPHDSQSYLRARRRDGSVAEITFLTFKNKAEFKIGLRKVHSIDKREVSVTYPRSSSKTTLPLTPEELSAFKNPPQDPSCMHHPERVGPARFLGNGTLRGLTVAKHEFKPSPRSIWEAWEAPDLDCAVVYIKTTVLDEKGKVETATIRTAYEIEKGDPAPWIFEQDSSSEMLPSQALSAELDAAASDAGVPTGGSRKHLTHPTAGDSKVHRQDADYRRRWRELRSK